MTSKRHSRRVSLRRACRRELVRRRRSQPVAAQEDQLVPAGQAASDRADSDSSTGSIVSTIPWIPNDEPSRVTALVVVGELDVELPGWRIQAALVLAAEAEAERRRAGEPGARRQLSTATARARRQHHSEDAGSGQNDRSPEVARCASLHSLPRRRHVRMSDPYPNQRRLTTSDRAKAASQRPEWTLQVAAEVDPARAFAVSGHCDGRANGPPRKQQRSQTAAVEQPLLQPEAHSGQALGHRRSRLHRAAVLSCPRPVRRRS